MNRAKGTRRRGGNANGKKREGARHRGQKGRARRCDSTERTHERAERRAGKAEIAECEVDDVGSRGSLS